MKLIASLENKEHGIEIENQKTLILDGNTYAIDMQYLSPNRMALIVNGRSYDVFIEKPKQSGFLEGNLKIEIAGQHYEIEVLPEYLKRLKNKRQKNEAESGHIPIRSPMPGRVLRVLVSAQEEVEEGQGLVVIEAMKMENELKSPQKARVQEIKIQPGQSIENGAVLITLF